MLCPLTWYVIKLLTQAMKKEKNAYVLKTKQLHLHLIKGITNPTQPVVKG